MVWFMPAIGFAILWNFQLQHYGFLTCNFRYFYLTTNNPGIIDKEIWECVQLEIERQKRYCQDHHISTYHRHSEKHPLSAKIICSACGCTYILIESNRVGEEGRKYWRCSSFKGKRGTEIAGRMYVPHPMYRPWNNPHNIKRRKKPQERQMLCTDIRIPAGEPEFAFIKAWNRLVYEHERYAREWDLNFNSSDILKDYRAGELIRLLDETWRIETVPYEVLVKTLDHIEIGVYGELDIIFLAGLRIDSK